MSSAEQVTPSEYITHHLGHLTNHGHHAQTSLWDMSYLNIDTVIWSVVCGLLGSIIMYMAARKATSGVPGRFQCAVEMLIEMVDNNAKSIVHGNTSFIAPMALSVFVWVLLMNSLDFLPVDLFSQWLFPVLGLDHEMPHRVVPTADLNGTLGISIGIFGLMMYYSFKIKGVGGFIKELFSAPFGPMMFPFNFMLNVVEYAAKTFSLGMRLFGNMFAGELLFLLIAALLGASGSLFGGIGHLVLGSAWSIFHILIVPLQAFIFMMLTLVYMGQAHEAH
ncbi:F0F1 ATP synthase subunit A [Undibacterium sp. CY18W]|uniref:ATP synthase subunit a n=1 Tax=Undibacterium hunanense TaxID=2762292 RepID=A0ABR6ZKV8_9BURK|nr:F0F1 ATP synthase subunit A [Undibacterium hunanense]MBC3916533.1 F0F1 ATP synthase subunit A [Undibacterium hunanense]